MSESDEQNKSPENFEEFIEMATNPAVQVTVTSYKTLMKDKENLKKQIDSLQRIYVAKADLVDNYREALLAIYEQWKQNKSIWLLDLEKQDAKQDSK